MTSLPTSAPAAPRSFFAALFCLLCLCVVSLPLCFGQNNLGSVVIYSASGCIDVGNVTVNCTLPTVITLQTSGVSALQISYQYILIRGPGAELYGLAQNDGLPLNDSLSFTLEPGGYTPSLLGVMLSIQLYNYDGNMSMPLAGLSLAPIPPPRLQSVSGCSGSGSATLGCQPNATTLTLTGQGLSWLSGGFYYLCIANGRCTSVHGTGPQSQLQRISVRVLNDSYAQVMLSIVYTNILLPPHYGGALVPLYFTMQSWQYCQRRQAFRYSN
jgi:hypothetical protein